MEDFEEKLEEWSNGLAVMGSEEYERTKEQLRAGILPGNENGRKLLAVVFEVAEMKRQDRRSREEEMETKPIRPVWFCPGRPPY